MIQQPFTPGQPGQIVQQVPAYINRVQTGSGKLTVDAQCISIERPGFPRPRTETLPWQSVATVTRNVTAKPMFGMGGGMHFTFHTLGGEKIEVHGIPWNTALILCDVCRLPRP